MLWTKDIVLHLKENLYGHRIGKFTIILQSYRGEKHINSHPSPNPKGPMLRIIWLNTKMNLCLLVWQAFNNSLWTAWHTAECLNCLKWLIYRFHKRNMLWCYDDSSSSSDQTTVRWNTMTELHQIQISMNQKAPLSLILYNHRAHLFKISRNSY